MYIHNDLIDSVSLERHKIVYPGYLSDFIRMLKKKHDEFISMSRSEPEFILDELSKSSE
jgi:hypothetical protein